MHPASLSVIVSFLSNHLQNHQDLRYVAPALARPAPSLEKSHQLAPALCTRSSLPLSDNLLATRGTTKTPWRYRRSSENRRWTHPTFLSRKQRPPTRTPVGISRKHLEWAAPSLPPPSRQARHLPNVHDLSHIFGKCNIPMSSRGTHNALELLRQFR